jgi:flagellar hook assembly protein FlgD
MYMVTSGTHVNSGCCFDYGNSETTRKADAAGAMDAIYFGTSCWFASSHPCSGKGPWVQADLEWGLYPGGSQNWNTNQKSFTSKYVTAMLKNNGTTKFALKGSDAQAGSLSTLWDGVLPSGYNPMKKQGAIILGSGGDCCRVGGGVNQSLGTFYEGAMVSGYPTDETDNAIQANIVSAGYGSATVSISNREFHIAAQPTLRFDPSLGKTTIQFELESARHVRLRVLDLRGVEVSRLLNGTIPAGSHAVTWDAKSGRAGMYSLVMEIEGAKVWTRSVVSTH